MQDFKPNQQLAQVHQAQEAIDSGVITPPTPAAALGWAQARGLARLDAQVLLLHALGACRTLGVDSENAPQRDQFLPDSQPHSGAMGQEDGKKWAAAAHSQPTIPKSDRLLGRATSDRAWLLAHDREPLPAASLAHFAALCARRAAGEPVAYLTGVKEFYGLPLAIDARVLDPRPDTELLVDWALEVLAGRAAPRVLDLGTGSGAIALALQHQRPDAQVLAVDASADALAVAQANARRLALPVQFVQGNWFEGVRGSFDLIVANPPYIATGDPHLPALQHEPLQALVSGAQGLDDLRRIVAAAPQHLAPGGWLLLEHGWEQAAAVRALLHVQGLAQVQSRRDLAGHERCSGAQQAACAEGSRARPRYA